VAALAAQHAVIRVRHAVVKGVRDFLDDQGFTLVDTPIFTPAACEGTTTLFGVPYFDEGTAYLTQSGQLYNEANAAAHGKVYCFGPTFRAEKSKTRRHLTEFWMVEPEMAFAHLEDAVKVAEGLIVCVIERVLETRKEELKVLERDVAKLGNVKSPFPWLHYDDAIKLIQAKGSETQWGSDFGRHRRDGDRGSVRPARRRASLPDRDQGLLHGAGSGTALSSRSPRTSWPPRATARSSAAASACRARRSSSSASTSTTCPKRRSAGTSTCASTARCRTAGFGMGIERLVTWICGLEHLRETIAFPRMLYRIYP
jgi:asparaginyl-tRNA synthetase